jgi:hypothetical protein
MQIMQYDRMIIIMYDVIFTFAFAFSIVLQ